MYQFRKDVQFMCGFAGYYGAGDFNREEVIDQMGERIAHRGPCLLYTSDAADE